MDDESRKELWELEDDYIDKRRAGEKIDIDEYCDRPYLTAEQKQELRESLLEYEASLDSLEELVKKNLDADAVWHRVSTRIAEYKKSRDIGALIAVYVFIRRQRMGGISWRGASENRLDHEEHGFRWEVLQEGNNLIFSLAARREDVGKYIALNIRSADNVKCPPVLLRWKQGGPKDIKSEKPIDPTGRVEFIIAETKLDMQKEEDFEMLERIFQEVELRIFEREG